MDFRSKGLGKRTVAVRLATSKVLKSGDKLYVSGTMEEPITWDYIMVLEGDDLVDFVGLLGDPTVAAYLFRSPDRWKLYRALLTRGARFLGLLLVAVIRARFSKVQPDEPVIEVPPPTVRKRKHAGTRRRLASRRQPATTSPA